MPRSLLSLALLALAAAPFPASARTAFAPPFPAPACGFACPCGCRPGDVCLCQPGDCPLEPFYWDAPWRDPTWVADQMVRAARGGCCPPNLIAPPAPELP